MLKDQYRPLKVLCPQRASGEYQLLCEFTWSSIDSLKFQVLFTFFNKTLRLRLVNVKLEYLTNSTVKAKGFYYVTMSRLLTGTVIQYSNY